MSALTSFPTDITCPSSHPSDGSSDDRTHILDPAANHKLHLVGNFSSSDKEQSLVVAYADAAAGRSSFSLLHRHGQTEASGGSCIVQPLSSFTLARQGQPLSHSLQAPLTCLLEFESSDWLRLSQLSFTLCSLSAAPSDLFLHLHSLLNLLSLYRVHSISPTPVLPHTHIIYRSTIHLVSVSIRHFLGNSDHPSFPPTSIGVQPPLQLHIGASSCIARLDERIHLTQRQLNLVPR